MSCFYASFFNVLFLGQAKKHRTMRCFVATRLTAEFCVENFKQLHVAEHAATRKKFGCEEVLRSCGRKPGTRKRTGLEILGGSI